MDLALIGLLIVNFIFLVLFLLGKEIIFKVKNKPNLIAFYSVFLAVMFVIYFAAIFWVVLFAVAAQRILPVSLLLFVAFPFVLGQRVTYEKLNYYANLQILALFGSLILALSFLKVY